MCETRESEARWAHLVHPLLFVALVAAPSLADWASDTPGLIAWIGIGQRVVDEGYVGGNAVPDCDCNKDGDNQPCPKKDNMNCQREYHTCYDDGINRLNHYCVGSGGLTECGGTSCKSTQYGTCVGDCGFGHG